MQYFRLLTPLLCLAPLGMAQMTVDQKISDFSQLAALYDRNYVPYELRRDIYGFDLLNISPWLDQIAKTSDDLSFLDLCAQYVASLHDSHDEFLLPEYATFDAWLHMDVDIFDGKVLIGFIDRKYLPAKTYPFVVGDEIVSVDGVAVADLITQFLPYSVNGSGNQSSRMRLAAASIMERFQGWMPKANQVGASAVVVINRQSGGQETYTIPWDKTGNAITKIGPLPSLHAKAASETMSAPRSESRRPQRPAETNGWEIYQGPPAQIQPDDAPPYMAPMMSLRHNRALVPAVKVSSVGLFPFGNPLPLFNAPSGFKQRLGTRSSDQFVSGTFPAGPYTIGFIRIATMEPTSETLALNQFYNEVLYFQQNTDGLVVDVMDNGGGDGCYSQDLASGLIPSTFRGLSQEVLGTLFWLAQFTDALTAAQQQAAPQWVVNLYGSYVTAVQQALAGNRGRTGSLPACDVSFNAQPITDTKGNVLAYTKPIVVLTDNFTLSAAEIFAMFMQDSKRATIFGMRTDGGGGTVLEYDYQLSFSEAGSRVTESLITRAQPVQTPGFPLSQYYDGMGIYPDVVQDYQTRDNLLNGGKTFVTALTNEISSLIQAQKK